MGWPLEARRSLFPDWPLLCDESSLYRRALHIPVQILAGKFQMEFLPTVSLLNKNVPIRNMYIFLGSRSERGGARRAPTKRVYLKSVCFCTVSFIFIRACVAVQGPLVQRTVDIYSQRTLLCASIRTPYNKRLKRLKVPLRVKSFT